MDKMLMLAMMLAMTPKIQTSCSRKASPTKKTTHPQTTTLQHQKQSMHDVAAQLDAVQEGKDAVRHHHQHRDGLEDQLDGAQHHERPVLMLVIMELTTYQATRMTLLLKTHAQREKMTLRYRQITRYSVSTLV
jgi:hypothetical protein